MSQPPAPQPIDGNAAFQIMTTLGEIRTDVAVIKADLTKLPDHESRLRKLEDMRSRIYGGAIVLGAIFGGGAGVLAVVIGNNH